MSATSLAALGLFAWVLASTAVAQIAARAPAVERPSAQRPEISTLSALEREFWRCDHAATQALLDPGTAMDCSIATEALKAQRFRGDFPAMLAWWRANKDAQHMAISGSSPRRLARLPKGRLDD